jgi:hypothetical protein
VFAGARKRIFTLGEIVIDCHIVILLLSFRKFYLVYFLFFVSLTLLLGLIEGSHSCTLPESGDGLCQLLANQPQTCSMRAGNVREN